MQNCGDCGVCSGLDRFSAHGDEGELVAKTSCPFPAPGNLGRKVRPGLCPGPAKGGALGTSLSVFAASA
jgi:hypothetical protein